MAERLNGAGSYKSAGEQIAAFAAVLDEAGLPPTSTLLLGLAGRGSKATAVTVARNVARERFERALQIGSKSRVCAPLAQAAVVGLDETQVRDVVRSTVETILAVVPDTFGGASDDRVLKLLTSLAGEVGWLKSTIDTERQLRRYHEAHGPLSEHQAPQGPATAKERRDIVQQLASSLERDRFSAHVRQSIDSADGVEE